MTTLREIHKLLVEEYRISRHIIWTDELSGKTVNDVTELLHLLVKASQGCKRGELFIWEKLVRHCIGRNMPPELLIVIDCYLRERHTLPPLPLIRLIETPYGNWQGTHVPLFDETDIPQMNGRADRPEPDREFCFKKQHGWTLRQPSLKPHNPHEGNPQANASGKHWLF